eukprot:Lithocolla_globosa_v1_NODE_3470_length_1661_cov_21.199875.p4 type:complete len:103 gc:universal NODE_3470_length_1661_cov_21.199875:1274-1582(+)
MFPRWWNLVRSSEGRWRTCGRRWCWMCNCFCGTPSPCGLSYHQRLSHDPCFVFVHSGFQLWSSDLSLHSKTLARLLQTQTTSSRSQAFWRQRRGLCGLSANG